MEIEVKEDPGNGIKIKVKGSLDRMSATGLFQRGMELLQKNDRFAIDLSDVHKIDSAGLATLAELVRLSKEDGKEISIVEVNEDIESAFSTIRWDFMKGVESLHKGKGFLESLGEAFISLVNEVIEITRLMANSFYWGIFGLFRKRGPRVGVFFEQMVRMGSEALPIVALIAFLVGLTMGLQAAYQLRQFGANIYIANLVGISLTRELGPLMTAIVLAGRSGASITAEIGTMMVTEEVDALKVMGLNPVRYLVIPKLYALSITGPLLTVMADGVGILGGFIVAVTYLDIGPSAYFNQTVDALVINDILTGLLKSLVFAWLITFISCHKGFSVRGSAEAVGRSTTASVVLAIFMIIVADCFFSTLFYFL